MITQTDINEMERTFVTKDDLKSAISELKSDLFEKIDPILKEVKANSEERIINDHKIADHDDRITALESTHS